MKTRSTLACFLLSGVFCPLCTGSPLADPETPPLSGYSVAFSDEFNGTSLDPRKWGLGINARNAVLANRETTYRQDNLLFKDGHLLLQAKKLQQPVTAKNYGGKTSLFHYTSGGINTENHFNLTGEFYIEIRCQLPSNPGGFCAFWTMPAKGSKLTAMDHHETDFFEFKCNPNQASYYQYFSSLWWHELNRQESTKVDPTILQQRSLDRFWIKQQKYKPHYQPQEGRVKNIDFTKPFTMGFKATKDQLSWHIIQQGSAYHTTPYMTFREQKVKSRPKSKQDKTPHLEVNRPVPRFHNYIILNYHVRNANWAGGPIDPSALPAEMKIDYLRVYQKEKPTSKP